MSLLRLIFCLLLVFGAGISAVSPAAGQDGRIVAVGDLHGDLDNALAVFRLAGLVNADGQWIGGDATLMQTGDMIDRGADSKGVMDLLRRLGKEAQAAGGRVICLLGNHEIMNLQGDWRYVSRGDLEAFGGVEPRKKAFSRTGEYGGWLAGLDVVGQSGDAVFVHGGLGYRFAAMGLGELNNKMRRSLLGGRDVPPAGISGVLGPGGPVWDRSYVKEAEEDACPRLRKVLRRLGASRMVVGHTTRRDGRIQSRCGGGLQVIDVGISATYGGNLAAWEWVSGDARALYPTGAVDLADPKK